MERRHYSGPECRALNTPQPNLVQLDPIICEIDPYVKYMQSIPAPSCRGASQHLLLAC